MKYTLYHLLIFSILLTTSGCLEDSPNTNESSNSVLPSLAPTPPNAFTSPITGLLHVYDMKYDSNHNLIFTDRGNNLIKKFSTTGELTTLAGSGAKAIVDGVGTNASFYSPDALAIDSNDNVFVGESTFVPLSSGYNSFPLVIRKVTPSGIVSSFATLPVNATNNNSGEIVAMAFNSEGDLIVATTFCIWKITPSGAITQFSGNNTQGQIDGSGLAAGYYQIIDISIDEFDNIWLIDPTLTGWNLRKLDATGNLVTVVPIDGSYAIKYHNEYVYIANASKGSLDRFDITNSTITTIHTNVFSISSPARSLTVHSDYGLFLEHGQNSIINLPWP